MDHQHLEEEQQLCDDGSILLSACHHFFGHDVHNKQQHAVPNSDSAVGGHSSNNDTAEQCISSQSAEPLPATSSSNSIFQNNSILLSSRARSMSPSTSSHPDDLLLNCEYYYASQDSSGGNDYWSTGYFDNSDFIAQTWLDVLQETETIPYCGAGAAILTAVIIIHPLALIGAAATAAVGASAAWAVGQFHDLDTGYQIWNNEDFGMLFWEEQTVANTSYDDGDSAGGGGGGQTSAKTGAAAPAIATVGSQLIIQQNEEGLRRAFLLEQEEIQRKVSKEESSDNHAHVQTNAIAQQQQRQHANVEKKLQSISLQETNRLIRVSSAPVKESSTPVVNSSPSRSKQSHHHHLLPPRHHPNKATQHPTTLPPSILSTQQSLDRHYPPLEINVVNEVQFHGLNTCEFFQVFFSNDAPYSMKEFQQKRGDVDIHYGSWKDIDNFHNLTSFKPGLLPLPPNSTKERVLTFNTLTKSYFGPAYAKATKIQRATQLNKHLLVIENQTQLADVPFSDRFLVLERWVVEAVKSDTSNNTSNNNDRSGSSSGSGGALYTCKLTVNAEVVMTRECKFEHQIRKKAVETFTDLTKGWCKLATKALEATKEQKRKRMRRSSSSGGGESDGTATNSGGSDAATAIIVGKSRKKSRVATQAELFAKHQKKFQELDDLISHDGVGIEVMHSLKAGAHSAFAEVLEQQSTQSSTSGGLLKLRDGTVVKVAGRRSRSLSKRVNRGLLRKLSSRVVSFSKQAR